jgi:hypothetical protein
LIALGLQRLSQFRRQRRNDSDSSTFTIREPT